MAEPVKKLPVTVITGFLGSGKTTLLNNLLRDPSMQDTAVIINEFGEISIDHLLVETSIENTFVLESGCICCTIRGDLIDTFLDLFRKAENGDVPPFSRILVETTGLAEPGSVLRTLTSDSQLTPLIELRAVVTTVDAANAPAQLHDFPEAVKQVAAADVILLTKTDLAKAEAVDAVRGSLKAINPAVKTVDVRNGQISPDELFSLTIKPDRNTGGLRDWIDPSAFTHDDHDHAHDHENGAHLGEGHSDTAIRSFCIVRDEPIGRGALEAWLGSVASLRSHDLLRVKGVVNVRGISGPVVIQGVQDIMHPSVQLPAWPDEDHRTRIVFITRDIPQTAIENSLTAFALRDVA